MAAKNQPAPVQKSAYQITRERFDNEAAMVVDQDDSLKSWLEQKLVDIIAAGDYNAINAIADESGLTPSKNLVGRTLEIQDLVLRESADGFRDGSTLQKFVIIRAVDKSTGEELIIDGGGDTFVAQLISMRDHYGFPFTGNLLAKRTSSGYDMLLWRFADPGRAPLY